MQKESSLQLGLTCWLSFKVAVLERKLIPKRLSVAEFRQKSLIYLVRKGPTRMRGSSSTSRRLRFDCINIWEHYYELLCRDHSPFRVCDIRRNEGLGVFVNGKSTSFIQASMMLKGYLTEISRDEFNELILQKYPSLMAPNFILFGPLSLANHSCSQRLSLDVPIHEKDGLFEGFQSVSMFLDSDDQKEFSFNEEILIDYGFKRCKKKVCKCFSGE